MIQGVIFDLDGTLIDSMGVWQKIDMQFLRESGVTSPPKSVSEKLKTMTIGKSAQFFIDEFSLDVTKEYVIGRIEELVRREYEENILLKPGAAEFLDYLDNEGIPYCVATATYKSLAQAVLRRCGIYERFKFILTDEEYPNGKKFPDIFLGAAERLGGKPENIIVIEDSLHCIKTASEAGFPTVAVYDAFSAGDREKIEKICDYYSENILDAVNSDIWKI